MYVLILVTFFQDVVPKYQTTCAVEWVDAEDPLFLLYTSGSTGKPKVLTVLVICANSSCFPLFTILLHLVC